ncbi:MAG: hypothetical protein ABI565_13880 [Vicinamibacteria bacterium]
MTRRTEFSLLVITGLLVLTPSLARAQADAPRETRYDEHYAPSRMLVALEDDLRVLDEDLAAVPSRSPRYEEFQQRADDIRRDVTLLGDQMRQHREGRHESPVGGTAEVNLIRQDIASLRDDIESAQVRRRGPGASFTVPAGTDIELMLDSGLSSKTSSVEDSVDASTVAAIRINGQTVLPAGAMVAGVVREVRSRSRGQKDGWIRLDFDAITLENGTRVSLRSHVVSLSATRSGNHNLKNGGLGALLGGVIGGLIDGKKGLLIGAAVGAGGGLLATQGEDVELPGGSLITIRLDAPLNFGRR